MQLYPQQQQQAPQQQVQAAGGRSAYTRKRTHLKPSQVAVLQESFVTNSLPDAAIRSRLARELDVSERTIQIWFQNRRAKARKLEANSDGRASLVPNVRTGWIESPMAAAAKAARFQPTFRTMMTPERYEESSPAKARMRPQRAASTRPDIVHHDIPYYVPTRAMSEGADRQAVQVPLPVNMIRIGSWARFMSLTVDHEWDLQCICHPLERVFIWHVQDNGHRFRMEMDFDQVHHLKLIESPDDGVNCGQLELDVAQVRFSMCQMGDDTSAWVRCGDFSENHQASSESLHILPTDQFDALKQAVLDLMSFVPDLAHKCILPASMPPPMIDCLNQSDITISPSTTPEPHVAYFSSPTHHHHHVPPSTSQASHPSHHGASANTNGAAAAAFPLFVPPATDAKQPYASYFPNPPSLDQMQQQYYYMMQEPAMFM
ncbi:hypothetical protein BC940DRAFT_262586 [Gongronella butleri]|nr:hypothetical protein BC940DRAFT_262586 [Gongronella butleri]